MIFFYDKQTGHITGTVNGRTHQKPELDMWVGDLKHTARLIVEWLPVVFFDKEGNVVDPAVDREKVHAAEFRPQHAQVALMQAFDNREQSVHDYKINTETMLFERL